MPNPKTSVERGDARPPALRSAGSTPAPLIDGWRAAWLNSHSHLSSPFRGDGMTTARSLAQIVWGESEGNPHGAEWEGVCHTRPDETRFTGLPAEHATPHPDCFCGIHTTDRLEHLLYIVESMGRFLKHASKTGRIKASIVLYRVVLIGDVLESAMYKHAPGANGRNFWGDPPNTWRGPRAQMVGPVITVPGVDKWRLGVTYGDAGGGTVSQADFLTGLPDAVETCRQLGKAQPRTRGTQCPECNYLNDHATTCEQATPWWTQTGHDRAELTK